MDHHISVSEFLEAEGAEDWRLLGEGACAYFPTGSLAAGARFADAVSRIDGVDDHPRGRGPGFWFQRMDRPREQRNRVHFDVWVGHDQAEARIAAALAAGGRIVYDEHAPTWLVLADPEGNEVCVSTALGRG